MRGGVALEEQSETKTEKQPVISGKVLWAALGACAVWLAAVGVMLIMKLTQPPLPPNMLDYTCELARQKRNLEPLLFAPITPIPWSLSQAAIQRRQ